MAEPLARVNWRGLYQAMHDQGIDVLAGASIENFFYIGDAYLMSHIMLPERLGIAIVPRQGAPALLVCECEALQTRQDSWIRDVDTYIEFRESPMQALARMLRQRGLATARIGIEKRFLAAGHAEELAGLLPGATLVPGDAAFQKARSVKMPAELALLRRAAVATEKAIQVAFQAARPGMTEKEVAGIIASGLLQAGASSHWIVFGSGDRTSINHPYAGVKRLTEGDILRVDVGGVFAGYQSDVARTAAIGRPTPEQESVYRRVREAGLEIQALLRPGARASDICFASRQALERRGFRVNLQAIGHSLGTGLHDFPLLRSGEDAPLVAGMVLAVEPAARDERGWIYHVEDTILIAEDGPVVWTDAMDKETIPIIA